MCTKSKKAITALNKHLNEIHAISNTQEGNTWKAALKDTINLYLGENSSISQRLDGLVFTRATVGAPPPGLASILLIDVYDESKKQDFENLILAAIGYIESNGVYKDPNKKNFISHWGNTQLISAIVSIVTTTFWIGYGIGSYVGKAEKDREIMQAENKAKDAENQAEFLKRKVGYLNQSIDSLNQNIYSLKKEIVDYVNNPK